MIYVVVVTIIGWFYLISLVAQYANMRAQNNQDMWRINKNFNDMADVIAENSEIYSKDREKILSLLLSRDEDTIPWMKFKQAIYESKDVNWDEELKKIGEDGEIEK